MGIELMKGGVIHPKGTGSWETLELWVFWRMSMSSGGEAELTPRAEKPEQNA